VTRAHRDKQPTSQRSRAARIVLLVAVALAGACQNAAGGGEEVLDFAHIAEAGPTIETSPSGISAVLRVSTTIDAVCAVAYGETEALGKLATDQEMGAGGHSDHEVLLSGLAPDTGHFYRLQGVGVDGRLYRSEILTFRTPPASEVLPGRNVAVDSEVVEVSSQFSEDFSAINAIDGDPATEWSTAGDGDDAYLVIDLGREVDVVAVGFHTRSMSDGSATAETFILTVDNADTHGPFPVGRAEVSFTGKVIRFEVDSSTEGNTGATEIEVFESSSS
jgi:hypothetical protein